MDSTLPDNTERSPSEIQNQSQHGGRKVDVYFSADVETDGPIPGPLSMLSLAIVYAGSFDGSNFKRPLNYDARLYKELKPISDGYEAEALRVNGLDRRRLCLEGELPEMAMTEVSQWVKRMAGDAQPVLVAYPLSFDWTSPLRDLHSIIRGVSTLRPRSPSKPAYPSRKPSRSRIIPPLRFEAPAHAPCSRRRDRPSRNICEHLRVGGPLWANSLIAGFRQVNGSLNCARN